MKVKRLHLSVIIFLMALILSAAVGVALLVVREIQLDNQVPNRAEIKALCRSVDGELGGSKCYKNGKKVKYE